MSILFNFFFPNVHQWTNDNKIIAVALKLSKKLKNVVLISRDINIRVKCDSLGIASGNYYKEEAVVNRKGAYTGVTVKHFDPADIQEFYDSGELKYFGGDLFPNEFLVLKGGRQSALGIFRENSIFPLNCNKQNKTVQGTDKYILQRCQSNSQEKSRISRRSIHRTKRSHEEYSQLQTPWQIVPDRRSNTFDTLLYAHDKAQRNNIPNKHSIGGIITTYKYHHTL